jgi:hypothetical protein
VTAVAKPIIHRGLLRVVGHSGPAPRVAGARVMAGLYDGMEEAPFKRVEGGYVFQARNPRFFGRSRHYLVNEAQKAEIAACLRDTLRKLKPWVMVAMVVLPLLICGGVFSLVTLGRATFLNTFAFILAVLVPYIAWTHIYMLRRLRPLIVDLPRTNQKITLGEGLTSFNVHMSFKFRLWLLCAMSLCVIGSLMMMAGAFIDGHFVRTFVLTAPGMILGGFYATYLGKGMINGARSRRAA